MSKIKLEKEQPDDLKVGFTSDVDELNVPFNRFTVTVTHPVSQTDIYFEYNLEDSASLLEEKEDGIYIEKDKVDFLKKSYTATEYENVLASAWRPAVRGVDVPEYWYDKGVEIIPKYTAMWDDVYVDKKRVKLDFNISCTGTALAKVDELIAKVEAKFPNELTIKSNPNNIVGMYYVDEPIRPPYKSNNTITVYHLYYDPDWFNKILEEHKVPDVGYDYRFWQGFKYDLDSKKRYLKLVISDTEKTSNYQKYPNSFIPRPQLPVCSEPYFAKIYSPDGIEADEYDVFFSTTPEIMKEYCEENNFKFPIPDDLIREYIWTYGIVYNKNTLEVKQIKGYIKISQDRVLTEEWLDWIHY